MAGALHILVSPTNCKRENLKITLSKHQWTKPSTIAKLIGRLQIKLNNYLENHTLSFGEWRKPDLGKHLSEQRREPNNSTRVRRRVWNRTRNTSVEGECFHHCAIPATLLLPYCSLTARMAGIRHAVIKLFDNLMAIVSSLKGWLLISGPLAFTSSSGGGGLVAGIWCPRHNSYCPL